jgi:hypothetical protein
MTWRNARALLGDTDVRRITLDNRFYFDDPSKQGDIGKGLKNIVRQIRYFNYYFRLIFFFNIHVYYFNSFSNLHFVCFCTFICYFLLLHIVVLCIMFFVLFTARSVPRKYDITCRCLYGIDL